MAVSLTINQVAETLRSRNCLGWIGAGVSASAGLPTWKALLKALVSNYGYIETQCPECKASTLSLPPARRSLTPQDLATIDYAAACISQNDLKAAASALRSVQSGDFIDSQLKEIFESTNRYQGWENNDPRKRAVDRRYKTLRAMNWSGIVTTNFDRFLEVNASKHWEPEPLTALSDNLALVLRRAKTKKPFLIYLHGNTNGEMIFADEDYARQYLAKPSLDYFLKALFLRYTIIFIGTQIDDEIVQIKQELTEVYRQGNLTLPVEIVLLPEGSQLRGKYLESTGSFKVLYYDPVDADHTGLDDTLEKLLKLSRAPGTADPSSDDDLTAICEFLKSRGASRIDAIAAGLYDPNEDPPNTSNLDSLTHNILYRVLHLVTEGKVARSKQGTYHLP